MERLQCLELFPVFSTNFASLEPLQKIGFLGCDYREQLHHSNDSTPGSIHAPYEVQGEATKTIAKLSYITW